MQIRRCRIKPGLNSEWTIQSKFLPQLVFQQNLATTSPDYFQLLRNLHLHSGTVHTLSVIVSREAPVDQLVEYSANVIRAAVLIIKVVCMLPHINRQQRLYPFGQGQLRIAGLDHLELVAVLCQPCPSAAELRRCRCRQFFLAGFDGTERGLDFLFQCRRWLTATFWREAIPIERVIPDLSRIIENPDLVRLACR